MPSAQPWSPDTWVAVWTAVGVMATIVSGFGFWMFRIDRAVQEIKRLNQGLTEFRVESARDRENIWTRMNAQDLRLNTHGERITRTETTIEAILERRK
jgi:hypothetical protein